MHPDIRTSLFCRAARGETTERTPIWLMRQAGRTDPRYLALRHECGLPLEQMFRNAELAACVTLLPKRFGVDALIFFQDILTVLGPMGAPFIFRPGPVLESPLSAWEDFDKLHTYDVVDELPFISETFRFVHFQLSEALPVLGFAGAPFTLLAYLLGEERVHEYLTNARDRAHALLDKLTTVIIDYLRLQVSAGATAFQLFESNAPLLDRSQYAEFALPAQQRIFDALRGKAPSIIFAREWPYLEDLNAAGADIISLPAAISISQARQTLGPGRVLQGNLDNHLLAEGPLDAITAAAQACVAEGEHRGHIFNLSHGLLRETPLENILHLIRAVHEA